MMFLFCGLCTYNGRNIDIKTIFLILFLTVSSFKSQALLQDFPLLENMYSLFLIAIKGLDIYCVAVVKMQNIATTPKA